MTRAVIAFRRLVVRLLRPRWVAHAMDMGGQNVVQQAFRARNDDGSETAATWIAAADTDWTQAPDTNFRVRFLIDQITGPPDPASHQLQYNHNAGGWTKVTDSSSVVKHSASTHFADGDSVTQQLGSGTLGDGEMNESGDTTNLSASSGIEMEVEWCLQIVDADTADDDTIDLRMLFVFSDTVYTTYTSIPTITVGTAAAAAPVFPRRQLTTVRM